MSLSEKTTLKLIGESIITRDGMKDNWADVCDELYSSISGNIHAFMGDPGSDLDSVTIKKIFPMHPMTVNLVSKVAGLAASNRSIFEFLKSNGDDGFRAYIRNNGQFDWKWVTPDYLWEYFFVNNFGGKKTLSKMAEDALKHYMKVKDQISDERMLRVFKGAMLLLATIGSGHSLKKSRVTKGIQATEKTLYDCFCGMLSKEEVSGYLQVLSGDPLNVLVLAPDIHEGSRIELPYSGHGDELEGEIARLKKENTPAKLFGADSFFGSVLKKQFVPEEKAVVKRLITDTCWGNTQQINFKFGELQKNVAKTHHKFGLLIVAVSNIEEIEKIKTLAASLLSKDETHRVMVCVMRHVLPEEQFDNWYELVANGSLAAKAGNTVNASSYKSQSEDLVGNWVGAALGKDMDLLYGETSSHVFTNKAVIASFEKIVFKVFAAAPEAVIKKITLYKSAAILPAYYGVSKTTLETKNAANDMQKNFNQQWQDCVDVLRDNDENVWDCNSVEEVIAMSETKVGRSMAALCSCLNKALTSGTVLLSDLWDTMQQELGYYDTGVCCYLIGFAMHFYVGKFTWFDGSNAHKLDETTIPTMIVSMLTGKSAGMKLSSESDVEKRFKDITRRVFGLSPDEVGDIYDCRKNVKIHTTRNGYPIWALKYLDDQEYSGIKDEICELVDKFEAYILENGNQTDILEDIVSLFKANPKAYVTVLSSLLSDKDKLALGMKNFVFSKAPDAKSACEQYGFSVNALFNMLSKNLEEEKWQWQEQEVADIVGKLVFDLKLVGIVNNVLGGTAESVEKVKETLANYLTFIRVPGCVYAALSFDWAPTVQVLHDISVNKWVGYSNDEKQNVISNLEDYIAVAIENITHPVNVLKEYIISRGMGSFSDAEFEGILKELPKEPYSQTEHSFKHNIQTQINVLAYTKKVKELISKWQVKTSTNSVSEWMSSHLMPIGWLLPKYNDVFAVLLALSRNERVDGTLLENAISELDRADLSLLEDSCEIDRCFVRNVASEKYYGLLLPHVADLKRTIQNAGFRDYSKWGSNIVSIRNIVEKYIRCDLKAEVSDKAKQKINSMNDIGQLKEKLNTLIEQSPEACLFLLDD